MVGVLARRRGCLVGTVVPGLIRLGGQAVKFWFYGLVIEVGADQGDQTKHDDD
jgi:hypothetical protein